MPEFALLEPETPDDAEAIERLNERVFGPGRFARTAYRLRERRRRTVVQLRRAGRHAAGRRQCDDADPDRRDAGAVAWAADRRAGVSQPRHRRSAGAAALEAAREAGATLAILVGDEPYYARMGFKRAPPGRMFCRGRSIPARLLYCESQPGAFEGVGGEVRGARARLSR